MPYELFVALRFLREGRLQTVLIFVGVGVGVAVMVFLTALIDGLQGSLIKNTLTTQAHVVIRPPEQEARIIAPAQGRLLAQVEKRNQRDRTIDQWPVVLKAARGVSGVKAAAVTVAGSAFATRGSATRSVALRGVEPEAYTQVIAIEDHLQAGQFRLLGTEAVVGTELAKDLGIRVGDKIRIASSDGATDVFLVSGIFDLGNKDVNQRWVFVSVRAAQTLLGLGSDVSTIELRVAEPFQAEAISREVAARTGFVGESWMIRNKQLLVALSSQSSSSYMIQFFVVLAVALGIASVLAVSVVQKSREIGILRATGTPTRSILGIFLIQGGIVGLVGAISGCLLGTGLALFFASLATSPDGSPTFPVRLDAQLMLQSSAIALAVGLLAAAIPARRAARLDPATVIRSG
jgi:lipoprotein-releasing system permease protein